MNTGTCKSNHRDLSITDELTSHLGESYLGYATSSGSVCVIKVTQSIREGQSSPDTELQMTIDQNPRILFQPDKRGVTALSWVEIPGKGVSYKPISVRINPNVISACSCALQTGYPPSLV